MSDKCHRAAQASGFARVCDLSHSSWRRLNDDAAVINLALPRAGGRFRMRRLFTRYGTLMTDAAAAPAAPLPMFYKNPVPLEPARHGQAGLKREVEYRFCAPAPMPYP